MSIVGNTRKIIRRWGALFALLVPAVITQAAGEGRQEKTVDTTATPRIGLSNLTGHVVVKGWDRSQVHAVWASTSPLITVDMDQLPAVGAAEKVHFTTHVPESQMASSDKTVTYTLDVPIGASLEIRNPEGRVDVEKVQGDTTVDSLGGIISLTEVAGQITANSISGDIEIIRPSGRVEATSICGNLRFVSPTGSALKAQTSAGTIRYEGDFVTGGEYAFKGYSGNIDLLLPPAASFELNKICRPPCKFDSEIAPYKARSVPLPRGAHIHTLLGSNISSTAAVKVSSFSGSIHIHRQR